MTDDFALLHPCWEFCRGEWRQIPNPLATPHDPDDWIDVLLRDDWRNFDTVLSAAGYAQESHAGLESTFVIHEPRVLTPLTRRWKYMVELCVTGDAIQMIFVVDLPSLLLLVPQLAAVGMPTQLEFLTETIDGFARKTFRVFHGHSLDSFCEECDPSAWKARQERRREIEQKKRQASQCDEAERRFRDEKQLME